MMIAYNRVWLNNLYIRDQADEALREACIEKQEWESIHLSYPVEFYRPNTIIRMGLFLLTTIILFFSFGLFVLFFSSSLESAIGALAIFFGIVSLGILEYLVKEKKLYRSGVDDALLWLAAIAIFGGASFSLNAGGLVNCILVFIIALYGALRFADILMSIAVYLALLGTLFFLTMKMGSAAKLILPFLAMALSAFMYKIAGKLRRSGKTIPYAGCLQAVSITALISFYASGNYYVVRELSDLLLEGSARGGQSVFTLWFFWSFTILVPFLYVAAGIFKKDLVLLRVGLLLVAAMVITIRQFYHLAPLEMMMTMAGAAMMLVAFVASRYLRTPKKGFANLTPLAGDKQDQLSARSILVAETLNASNTTESSRFGGGSFGGGGATGDF